MPPYGELNLTLPTSGITAHRFAAAWHFNCHSPSPGILKLQLNWTTHLEVLQRILTIRNIDTISLVLVLPYLGNTIFRLQYHVHSNGESGVNCTNQLRNACNSFTDICSAFLRHINVISSLCAIANTLMANIQYSKSLLSDLGKTEWSFREFAFLWLQMHSITSNMFNINCIHLVMLLLSEPLRNRRCTRRVIGYPNAFLPDPGKTE